MKNPKPSKYLEAAVAIKHSLANSSQQIRHIVVNDDKVRIFRLEKDGEGPYTGAFKSSMDMAREHSECDEYGYRIRPAATDFGYDSYSFPAHLKFACDSLEKLLWWFDGWMNQIIREGFKINEYEIEKRFVIKGNSDKQVVFNKDNAKFIREVKWR
jgi:hypothetical protein